jgi:hypothetical protein
MPDAAAAPDAALSPNGAAATPPSPLEGLWHNLEHFGGKVEGGLEGLWAHLKSGHAKAEADLPAPMRAVSGAAKALAGDAKAEVPQSLPLARTGGAPEQYPESKPPPEPPSQAGRLTEEDQVRDPEAFAKVGGAAAKAVGGDIADIGKGIYQAGPGTLEKVAKGEIAPGSPEMAEAARTTALTFGVGGAPEGTLATGFGRGPPISTPGFRARTTPLPPGQQAGLTDLARGVSHAIETTVSPTTVDTAAKMAEASIDKSLGQARRETAVANNQLEQYRPLVAPLMPEFQEYTALNHQARASSLAAGVPYTSNIPKPAALRFIDHVESASKGAPLDPDIAHLKPLADTMRGIVQQRRAAIAADPLTDVNSFIDDYYSHQWAEKTQVPTLLYGTQPRMGSGGSLKKRSIPTISEGIDAGLTPTSFDPVETTMRYVANMDRYLASNEIFATGKDAGMIKFHEPGQAPAGWAPLNGRLTETPYGQKAFAPEGYARVYNRSAHVDPGWANAPGFQAWNMAKNAVTQSVLGFSGYHYMAMTQEAAVSKFAEALGHLKPGEFAEAAQKAGLASTLIGPLVQQLPKGRKLQQAYLRTLDPRDPAAPLYNRIADDVAAAGGRVVGRGQEWRGSAMDDYWTAFRRGTLANEIRLGMRHVTQGPVTTMPLRAGSLVFREAGRLMETLGKPLFDHMVPNLKGAAFFDEMESWLRQNPGASKVEELAQARQLWDAVDDRFGQMVMDRVFWNQRLKQGLQSVMVSPGWEVGSVRAVGGGAADLLSRRWTPRTRWLMSFPVIVGLSNAVYQYLRTGSGPEGPTDVMAPRTGGTTPEGVPERAILPGYEKDPLGWYKDPAGKIAGMQNPLLKAGREMITGRDAFTGQPVVEEFPGAPPWLAQWGMHILKNFQPIPVQQFQRRLPGSAISVPEQIAGIRPAPAWITDPDRARGLERAARLGETSRALGTQIYQAKRRGDLEEVRKLIKERALTEAQRKRTLGQVRAHEAETKHLMRPQGMPGEMPRRRWMPGDPPPAGPGMAR